MEILTFMFRSRCERQIFCHCIIDHHSIGHTQMKKNSCHHCQGRLVDCLVHAPWLILGTSKMDLSSLQHNCSLGNVFFFFKKSGLVMEASGGVMMMPCNNVSEAAGGRGCCPIYMEEACLLSPLILSSWYMYADPMDKSMLHKSPTKSSLGYDTTGHCKSVYPVQRGWNWT